MFESTGKEVVRPSEPHPLDVVPPAEIARLVEEVGVKKAAMPALQTLTLAMLAGAFIAFGGLFQTMTVADSALGFGPTRLLGGLAFSLGLVLVVIGGAELFTGNCLIVMAWADRRIGARAVLRNWGLVYAGNFAGALAIALLVHLSGVLDLGSGAASRLAISAAEAKAELGFVPAFVRGLLCNVFVCLAVWMCFAARTVTGKAVVIALPVAAFITAGLEHSVANMYLIPIGMLEGAPVGIDGFLRNLIPVTLGNMVGGGVLVAMVYWLVYLRRPAS